MYAYDGMEEGIMEGPTTETTLKLGLKGQRGPNLQ